MNKFVEQPLLEKLNRENILTRLRKVEERSGVRPSASVGSLSELTQATGSLVVLGNIKVINQTDGSENVVIDEDGINIKNQTDVADSFLVFRDSAGEVLGRILTSTLGNLEIDAIRPDDAALRKLVLRAQVGDGSVYIAGIEIIANSSGFDIITNSADFIYLNGATYINQAGADKDTVIRGLTDDELLVVDAGTDKVLISGFEPGKFLIYDQTLGGTAASINLYPTGVLPTGFKHLEADIVIRTDKAAVTSEAVNLEINDDATGSNYSTYVMWHNFDNVMGDQSPASSRNFCFANAANAPADEFAAYTLHIYDYNSATKKKHFQSRGGQRVGTGTGDVFIYDAFGTWISTAAITKIELTPGGANNFIAGTRVTLWGVK